MLIENELQQSCQNLLEFVNLVNLPLKWNILQFPLFEFVIEKHFVLLVVDRSPRLQPIQDTNTHTYSHSAVGTPRSVRLATNPWKVVDRIRSLFERF